MIIEKEPIHGAESVLPFDFTRDVPPNAWKWLLQYGLSYQYWKNSVGYSPYHERLVFTVGNPHAFSIGRYVGSHPETSRKWWAFGNVHKHAEVIDQGNIAKLVLVEDIVSAHKVAQVAAAMPLFGVEVHPCHQLAAQIDDRPLVLWLDHDQSENTYRKATRLMAVTGKKVEVVVTPKDPKEYEVSTIQRMLE